MATRVIKLGADLAERGPADADQIFAATFPALAALRFLLAVGTVEPRKNHALLLQAFDRLEAKDAGLVIVGRKGWMADDVAAALTGHPEFGKRLFWYEALDDPSLVALYRHAHASVLPSQYEGYGLPVVEALSQGCATVVSDAGSLPHAGPARLRSSRARTARRCLPSSTASIATRATVPISENELRASGQLHGGGRERRSGP
jgi:glycosyltransferase involved in cell wall biosynthesis